jgi:hypothetical protein
MFADRIKETTATTGTGSYSLAGAVAGFQTFVAGVGSGNSVHYVVENGTDWEIGVGTVTDATPDTLTRTTIIASSNANAAVNWTTGGKTIFCTPPARNLDIATARHNFNATTAPTGSDDNSLGYGMGSLWVDQVGYAIYQCTDPTPSAAWIRIGATQGIGNGVVLGYSALPGASDMTGFRSAAIAPNGSSTVAADNGVIMGHGHNLTSTAIEAFAHGAKVLLKSQQAYGQGFSRGAGSAVGEHQFLRVGFVGQTTDATATELFLSSYASTPASRFVVPTDSAINFEIKVTGIKTDGSAAGGYTITGLVLRDGAADPVFVGTPTTTVVGETNSAWDCALTIDTTNDSLKITVTGAAATTINWTAVLKGTMAAASPT